MRNLLCHFVLAALPLAAAAQALPAPEPALFVAGGAPVATAAQVPPVRNRFELEADPLAYWFRGYSLHLGHVVRRVRFDAGVFGIQVPAFALANNQFTVFSAGYGVKADYLLQPDKGVFLGLQSDYVTDKIRLESAPTSSAEKMRGLTVGVRAGYRFLFGKAPSHKGLYLVPWVAYIHALNAAQVQQQNQTYRQPAWSFFPTIHLGYRF